MDMITGHIVLGVLWAIYCVLHSVLASGGIKKKMQQWLGKGFKFYRLAYTLFAFFGLVAILWFQIMLASPLLLDTSTFTIAVGSILTFAGLVIMGICISKYFMSLSGIKSLVQEQTYSELIISGIHRYVRHPLYLGTFLFIWGLLVIIPVFSLFLSNLIITIYTLAAIRLEEAKLIDEFGESYRRYQQSVPKILPSFKPNRSI
jgi:protein-S-isoprenylcysteine O-methyltransferase Ste14